MPSALIAPAIGAAINIGASKLMGGKKGEARAPLANFQPTGISGGGLNTGFSDGNITIAPTAERLGLVKNLASQFGAQANELGALRDMVAPGYSALRASRLGEIENARTAAVGNLRENLARRRVLGSSFGQDALTRAESEFAGQRDRVAAESFLSELEATNNLINQQFAAHRGEFQTSLDELNLEADAALKLSSKATDALAKNAQVMSALNAQEAAGAGKFFGQTVQPFAKAAGDAAGKWFSNLNFGGSSGPDLAGGIWPA